MTMFSRNDKVPEAAPAPKPAAATPTPVAAAPTPPPPTPQQSENRRVQMPASSTSSAPSVSVISKALKITGQLESTEDIHIEGEVEGDVRGGSVKVGQSAKINGTVYGEEVELSGTVNGKIEARKVVLTSTAHMSGDVIHQDIRIDSGAYIDGHCRPEYGRPDGKAHAVQKPAATSAEPRSGFASAKPTEVRSIA
jgi:cytoskeletal protein CcmA (bactofilin family)